MKINEYLDYVFNEINTNKTVLGVQDVFKHNDYSRAFKSPAVFCEVQNWREGEERPFMEYVLACLVFVRITTRDFDTARGQLVDIIQGLKDLFETDPGSNEYPPDFSVEFGTAVINAKKYFVADVELSVELA